MARMGGEGAMPKHRDRSNGVADNKGKGVDEGLVVLFTKTTT